MAYKVYSYRLPEEYAAEVASIAKELGVSQGYILQVFIYGASNEHLPPPMKRDPNSKTQQIETGEASHEGTETHG
jgi:hypothetical protein